MTKKFTYDDITADLQEQFKRFGTITFKSDLESSEIAEIGGIFRTYIDRMIERATMKVEGFKQDQELAAATRLLLKELSGHQITVRLIRGRKK